MRTQPGLAETAAARLARLPWRRLAPPDGAAPALQRGWIGGLKEAAAVVEELAGVAPREGRGFGGTAPWAPMGGAVIACGVPVAVGTAEVQGPDGAYRLRDASVLREAAGRAGEVLRLDDAPGEGTGTEFDLLWFGISERYIVRGARVEIEDLFARVVAPADPEWLENVLLRRSRRDAGLLEGVSLMPSEGAATVEVCRPEELTGEGWDDPQRLIAARETVRRVEGGGRWLRVLLESGEELEAAASAVPEGWVAHFEGEGLPWRRLWCHRDGDTVVYGAEPTADPRDPGVRTRWAFDLMSDLLKLGGK